MNELRWRAPSPLNRGMACSMRMISLKRHAAPMGFG